MATGSYSHIEMAALLSAYRMRSLTVAELGGLRDALLDLALPVNLADYDAIDLCGTGGDGKDTFNISTVSAFVVAGAGVKVAKHGNHGVSSGCGSSDVMQALGYRFTDDSDALRRQLDEAGICFLHAPLFHPAMKAVAPVRRTLGVKTFFNLLGPLVNPARPRRQMMGVFNLETARLYHYLMQQEQMASYTILHSLDGYDEVSLTGTFKALTERGEQLLTPQAVGLECVMPDALHGGRSVGEAAQIFQDILKGKGTSAQRDVVTINAALAIRTAQPELSLGDALAMARESLESGAAYQALRKLLSPPVLGDSKPPRTYALS